MSRADLPSYLIQPQQAPRVIQNLYLGLGLYCSRATRVPPKRRRPGRSNAPAPSKITANASSRPAVAGHACTGLLQTRCRRWRSTLFLYPHTSSCTYSSLPPFSRRKMQAIARPLARIAPKHVRYAGSLSVWSAVPAGPPDPILGTCRSPRPVLWDSSERSWSNEACGSLRLFRERTGWTRDSIAAIFALLHENPRLQFP